MVEVLAPLYMLAEIDFQQSSFLFVLVVQSGRRQILHLLKLSSHVYSCLPLACQLLTCPSSMVFIIVAYLSTDLYIQYINSYNIKQYTMFQQLLSMCIKQRMMRYYVNFG